VRFVEKFQIFLPLDLLRQNFVPEELPMLRKGNRLSVTPVPAEAAERILAMVRIDEPTLSAVRPEEVRNG